MRRNPSFRWALLLLTTGVSLACSCSVAPLTGAKCEGSHHCPAKQRCAAPTSEGEPWGRCTDPGLDVPDVVSPSGRLLESETVEASVGSCPPLTPGPVDLQGDWLIEGACVDEAVLAAVVERFVDVAEEYVVDACNEAFVRADVRASGAFGPSGSAAVRSMTYAVEFQVRVTPKPGTAGQRCDTGACAEWNLHSEERFLRCREEQAGQCLCSGWLGTTKPLSGTVQATAEGFDLTPEGGGASEGYEAAREGDRLRVRKRGTVGEPVAAPVLFTLTLAR